MVLRKDFLFFGAVVAFALAVSIFAFTQGVISPLTLLIRLLALNGFIAVSVAAVMAAFIKEITVALKKPFTKLHHYFAATGLLLLTVHPIAIAIQTLNPAVLLPNFGSLELFFVYGGSVALLAIYVAFGAVMLRRKIMAFWRPFHMLMYVALFFGLVHANLLGFDFQNVAFQVVYDGLFAAVVFAFAWKRWQLHQLKVRMKKLHAAQKKA